MKKALLIANMLFASVTVFGKHDNQIQKANQSELFFSRTQLGNSLKILDDKAAQSKWRPQKWKEVIKKKIKEGKLDYFNGCPNDNGWTPVMYAARYSTVEVLRTLLELRDKNGRRLVDINKQNKEGKTAVMMSLAAGDIDKFNLLLNHGADVFFVREYEIGVNVSEMITVANLMNFGQGSFASFMREALTSLNKYIDLGQDLANCAKKGDLGGIEGSLSSGAYINYRDQSRGASALHQTIINKQIAAFDFLINQQDTDICVKDKSNNSTLLFAVLFNEDPYILRKLLSYRDSDGKLLLDVNERDRSGWFPLVFAVNKGFLENVKELLKIEEIEVNQEFSGYTPLMIATLSEKNRFEIMQELIRKGADCNIKDKDGLTLLMRTVTENKLDILKEFLTINNIARDENWADVKLLNINDQDNEFKTTALMKAVYSNSREIVELLMNQSDIQVCLRDVFGHTALWYAVSDGYKNIVDMLLKKYDSKQLSDEINEPDFDGNTLWNLVCDKANLDVIELLLNHLPENVRIEKIPDVLKIKQQTVDAIESIRKTKPVLQEKKSEIVQAFKNSVKSQRVSDIKILLNAKDENGKVIIDKDSINDALIVASSNGYLDVVKLLLTQDIDINFRDNEGNTSLMHAAKNGYYDVISVLHNNGASLNILNNENNTALMLAADNAHVETVRMLIKKFKTQGQDIKRALSIVEQNIDQLRNKNRNGNKNDIISVYESIKDLLNVRSKEVEVIKNSTMNFEKAEVYWPIFFSNNSKKELEQLEQNEPVVYEKLMLELLQLSYDPFTKKKPKLSSGLLAMNITNEHRLVYYINGAEIRVVHCKGHYNENANKKSRKDVLKGIKFEYLLKNRSLIKM